MRRNSIGIALQFAYTVLSWRVAWDIFNGGRLKAAIKEAEASTRQALLNYEQLALVALAETEAALAGFALSAQQRDILSRGVDAAREALKLASLQYSAGTLDFLTLLTAQQRVLTLEDELVQTQGYSAETLVEVYRSIGGGWTPGQPPPTTEPDDDSATTVAANRKESM